MKTYQEMKPISDNPVFSRMRQVCQSSCDRVRAGIQKTKAALFAEARGQMRSSERLLRQALNEAEAIAWQTSFPHLIFPALAMERVQTVTGWHQRQQVLRRRTLGAPLTT